MNEWTIITKFPASPNQPLKTYLNESLSRLNINATYGYLAHRAEDLIEKSALRRELRCLKEIGLVKKTGVSLYSPEQLRQLWKLGFRPDLVQVPFNILDQRFATLFEELHGQGTEIHTRSAFLQGLFFADVNVLPAFFNPIKSYLLALTEAFPKPSVRAAHLLKFCIDNPYVDRVVIGVNSPEQLMTNMELLPLAGSINLPVPAANPKLLMPHLWPKQN